MQNSSVLNKYIVRRRPSVVNIYLSMEDALANSRENGYTDTELVVALPVWVIATGQGNVTRFVTAIRERFHERVDSGTVVYCTADGNPHRQYLDDIDEARNVMNACAEKYTSPTGFVYAKVVAVSEWVKDHYELTTLESCHEELKPQPVKTETEVEDGWVETKRTVESAHLIYGRRADALAAAQRLSQQRPGREYFIIAETMRNLIRPGEDAAWAENVTFTAKQLKLFSNLMKYPSLFRYRKYCEQRVQALSLTSKLYAVITNGVSDFSNCHTHSRQVSAIQVWTPAKVKKPLSPAGRKLGTIADAAGFDRVDPNSFEVTDVHLHKTISADFTDVLIKLRNL